VPERIVEATGELVNIDYALRLPAGSERARYVGPAPGRRGTATAFKS